MSNIQVVDFRDADAGEKFATSLRETGFGVISHHPIDQDLINRCYADWEKFFQGTEKFNYEFDPIAHDGYISTELSETAKGHTQKDLKEFFHLYESTKFPEELRPQTMELREQMVSMAKTLLVWIEANLPEEISAKLSMPLSDMLNGSIHNLLRILHYPPLRGDEPEGAIRAAAHGDINLITVLPAATAEGLQAQSTDGSWVDVPINSNWIIINAGDMLEEATGGFYPSTQHRVMNPTGEAAKLPRLSMPFFLHPEASVKLSERHTADSYRWERYRELGLTEDTM